jgi:hypothetical protein
LAGGVLARPGGLTLLLWISLIMLFGHQFEEYRYLGSFPGMMNTVRHASTQPDCWRLEDDRLDERPEHAVRLSATVSDAPKDGAGNLNTRSASAARGPP